MSVPLTFRKRRLESCLGQTLQPSLEDKKQKNINALLYYDPKYKILVCRVCKYALQIPSLHLRQAHLITGAELDTLAHDWRNLELCRPGKSRTPPDDQEERSWLRRSVDGYSCTGCRFVAQKYSDLIKHWSRDHRLNLDDIPAPTFESPKTYAICVRMQTLFPAPNADWFRVLPAHTVPRLKKFILVLNAHHVAQRKKAQRLNAAEHKEGNEQRSILHRLPSEIRNQIYDLALGSGIAYHIEDMFRSGEIECDCLPEADDVGWDDFSISYQKHSPWRCAIEEDLQNFYRHDQSYKLRATSLSPSSRHPVSLLQSCKLADREATPIFYSRNRFVIHVRWGNWTSVNQFLGLLRPETRRCVQELGVMSLRPAAPFTPKLQMRYPSQATLHYTSMKMFLNIFVPQLSLRYLLLCVDLCDLYTEPDYSFLYTPQAPWLNPLLRLSVSSFDIRIANEGSFGHNQNAINTNAFHLVDRLNAIDFRAHIRGQCSYYLNERIPQQWWNNMSDTERVKERDALRRYRNQEEGYSYWDIWAECAANAAAEAMAEARNPYK